MATPYHHAASSAKKFGGVAEDYLAVHQWFDASKAYVTTCRHRALRHHTEGVLEAERLFGAAITNSENKKIPTRLIGEQHVIEDMGFLPTPADWLKHLVIQPWMRHANPGLKPNKTNNLISPKKPRANAKHKNKNSNSN